MTGDNHEGMDFDSSENSVKFSLFNSPINKVFWVFMGGSVFIAIFGVALLFTVYSWLGVALIILWILLWLTNTAYVMYSIYNKPWLGMDSKHAYLAHRNVTQGEKGKKLEPFIDVQDEPLYKPIQKKLTYSVKNSKHG